MRAHRPRADPLPLSWEVPTAVAASWLLLAVLALPGGQAVAGWLNGGALAWPAHGRLLPSLTGLIHGQPGRGLSRHMADQLPADAWVYAAITATELLLAAAVAYAVMVWWCSIGPGAAYGIATRSAVQRVLGPGNLRRRRATVRPDVPHRQVPPFRRPRSTP